MEVFSQPKRRRVSSVAIALGALSVLLVSGCIALASIQSRPTLARASVANSRTLSPRVLPSRTMMRKMATPRPVGSSLKRNLIAPRASTSDEEDSLRCRLDEIERCSVAELQVLYIDALWAYYHGGKDTLSDEEFDRIKSELCWQGSGFPTLRRYEVDFVQASLSYYRGEPVVSDEEYEALKQKVRESGKRKDVTAMLLYTKGQEALSDEQFALFADDMRKLGVDVKITEQNLMCTLSDTTDKLNNEIGEVIRMYAAIGAIPQTISVSTWALLSLLFGGPAGLVASAPAGVPVAGLTGAAITTFLIKYLGLDDPQVLLGVCPCCESEVKGFFSSRTPVQQDVKCSNCGTQMVFDSNLGKIVSAGGFEYLSSANSTSQVSFDYNDVVRGVTRGLAEALPTIASPELKKSTKPKLAKGEKEPLVDQLKTGIFAWAVLAGYAIFGEKFIGRVRGKGIALHSGVINDFCKEFSVPNAMRQKYIQTAKKNGHDLGFLVPGGYFGDGLAGEAAMKWWRSTGW